MRPARANQFERERVRLTPAVAGVHVAARRVVAQHRAGPRAARASTSRISSSASPMFSSAVRLTRAKLGRGRFWSPPPCFKWVNGRRQRGSPPRAGRPAPLALPRGPRWRRRRVERRRQLRNGRLRSDWLASLPCLARSNEQRALVQQGRCQLRRAWRGQMRNRLDPALRLANSPRCSPLAAVAGAIHSV